LVARANNNKIVGVQSRNKSSLWNVERKEWAGLFVKTRIPDKKSIFFKQIYFQKILKLKIYYAKWTLQIEVVNGNFFIYNCIFRVYLVTGPIKSR
jgi:hypothetical protein